MKVQSTQAGQRCVVPRCNGADERLLNVGYGINAGLAVPIHQHHVCAVRAQQVRHHCHTSAHPHALNPAPSRCR